MYPKGKFGSKPNIEFTDCENLDGCAVAKVTTISFGYLSKYLPDDYVVLSSCQHNYYPHTAKFSSPSFNFWNVCPSYVI